MTEHWFNLNQITKRIKDILLQKVNNDFFINFSRPIHSSFI